MNYGEYYATHGNFFQAFEILKEGIQEARDYKTRELFNKKIANIINNKDSLMNDYLKEINAYEPFYKQQRE